MANQAYIKLMFVKHKPAFTGIGQKNNTFFFFINFNFLLQQAYQFLEAAEFKMYWIAGMARIQSQFRFVTMLSDVSRGSGLDA